MSWLLTFGTQFLATNDQALSLLAFLPAAPPDDMYQSEGFSFDIANCVKPVHGSDKFRSPSTFQQSLSEVVFVLLITSTWAHKASPLVQRGGVDEKKFGLHCHPTSCVMVETRPILLEDHLCAPRLSRVDPV